MSFYDNLSMDKVYSFYALMKLLEKLRAIGHLNAHTVQATNYSEPFGSEDVWDFATMEMYAIVKDSYDPSNKRIELEEKFNRMFGGKTTIKLRGT